MIYMPECVAVNTIVPSVIVISEIISAVSGVIKLTILPEAIPEIVQEELPFAVILVEVTVKLWAIFAVRVPPLFQYIVGSVPSATLI